VPVDLLVGLDKAAVARRFNRSAATYDASCRVQRRMAGRLLERLDKIEHSPGRILELGCGTGFLTAMLARRFPGSRILAVDFAERMIDIARGRGCGERTSFRVADAEVADFGLAGYDLIVSNATVQWFEEPSISMSRLAAALRPGGWMLHSSFGPATFRELKLVLRSSPGLGVSHPHPAGLPLRSAPEWEAVLRAGGLDRVECDSRLRVVYYADAAGFLRELQATGATYRPAAAGAGRMTPAALGDALARYDRGHRSPEGVPVTYELLEIIGRSPWSSTT